MGVQKEKWFAMLLSLSCKNIVVEPGGLFSTKFKSNIFISVKHRRCLIIVIKYISGKQILVEDQ
jgi:hypothetical protein